ncbi:MAG: CPBP family intramembrane metalloprotease [Candidatus Aminicenantes bacterium]|nr:CPBP family intramembrane metalloprotease [Candidatus Aminicenantes bacterium]
MTARSARSSLRSDLLAGFVVAHLFVLLFAGRRIVALDFWWWMSFNIVVLLVYAFLSDRSYVATILSELKKPPVRNALLGILSALLLYGFFAFGNWMSRELFSFAGTGIADVYRYKEGASLLRIALLMGFVIGPGEELVWRGFLQRRWENRFGRFGAFIGVALLYAAVHAVSGNIMLILAAAVCGLFWGFLYYKFRSIVLVVVSHTLWDIMVFLVFPLGE